MCLGSVNEAAYIQFWTFASELEYESILSTDICVLYANGLFSFSKDAQLKFLLEIPDVGSIMALRWCPAFEEEMLKSCGNEEVPAKRVRRTRSKGGAQSPSCQVDILGYLAVSTNTGQIMIYR